MRDHRLRQEHVGDQAAAGRVGERLRRLIAFGSALITFREPARSTGLKRAAAMSAGLALVLLGSWVVGQAGTARERPASAVATAPDLALIPLAEPALPAESLDADTGGSVAAVAAVEAPAPTGRVVDYTVREGDTLRGVAEAHGIRVQTLIAANELANPDLLRVGQRLRVPFTDGVVYELGRGETIREIGERYGTSVSSIIEANGLSASPDSVAEGTLLVIPGVAPLPTSAQPAGSPRNEAVATAAEAPPSTEPVVAEPGAAAEQTAAAADATSLALKPLVDAPRQAAAEAPPAVTAQYVAIIDEASGAVLYGDGERTRVAPASTTKIATTLVALERAPDLSERLPVTVSGSAMAARNGSSIMGLEPGRSVTVATLLYGMMLPSGNDAAEQVASSLAGSRERYVAWMNEKVSSLGLADTRFANPSGMDAPGHYSTAYDMALLGRAAMRNESFRELAGAATYRGDGFNLTNLNRLIGAYPGADGIKIGYTRAAGKTIVASATRDGHRVYVSLMRSTDLPGDSRALFEWVWRTFEW